MFFIVQIKQEKRSARLQELQQQKSSFFLSGYSGLHSEWKTGIFSAYMRITLGWVQNWGNIYHILI